MVRGKNNKIQGEMVIINCQAPEKTLGIPIYILNIILFFKWMGPPTLVIKLKPANGDPTCFSRHKMFRDGLWLLPLCSDPGLSWVVFHPNIDPNIDQGQTYLASQDLTRFSYPELSRSGLKSLVGCPSRKWFLRREASLGSILLMQRGIWTKKAACCIYFLLHD